MYNNKTKYSDPYMRGILRHGSSCCAHCVYNETGGAASTSMPTVAAPDFGTPPTAPVAVPVTATVTSATISEPFYATSQPQQDVQEATASSSKQPENTGEKCSRFFASLLTLSSKEPATVENSVRGLIQNLIDAVIEPEDFYIKLKSLMHTSLQQGIVGFLKESLPLLRQSLIIKELYIAGVNPPPPHVAFPLLCEEGSSRATLPPLQSPQVPLNPSPGPFMIISPGKRPAVSEEPPKPKKIAVLQNVPVKTKISLEKMVSGKNNAIYTKADLQKATVSCGLNTVLTPGKNDKQNKPQVIHAVIDDINDVAAMGGVNLAEESLNILGSGSAVGTQIRSCKEKHFANLGVLQSRIREVTAKHGLAEPDPLVASLLSHAVEQRLKIFVEQLAVIVQHRLDSSMTTDPRYEPTQDVKGQLNFLEEVYQVQQKRAEDANRDALMRAAKSRGRSSDPEQAKLKAMAKEMQRAEMEELRNREANTTALQAIGPPKNSRFQTPAAGTSTTCHMFAGLSGSRQMAPRPNIKKVTQRDILFALEQDRTTRHSRILYEGYLK